MKTRAVNRRALLGAAGAVVLTGSPAIRAQEATPAVAGGIPDGVAGGGTLQGMGGVEVTFAISVFSLPDSSVHGVFRLDDTAGAVPVVVESLRFDVLEPLSEKAPDDRRIVGWATLNGAGEYPFLLQVLFEDAGAELNLVLGVEAEPFITTAQARVCECGGFSYGLRSAVSSGDIVRFGEG